MQYETYSPSPELAYFVKCYWTLEAAAGAIPEKQRIIPDGCMEMIFQLADPYKQYFEDGSSIVQPHCFVFGQITRPLEIEPTGHTHIFAVRFLPDGFKPFSSVELFMMENRAVPLIEIFGESAITVEQSLRKVESVAERVTLIDAFLLNKLCNTQTVNRITKESVDLLLSLNGLLSVTRLSETIAVNRRQLERKFADVIGLSPKQLAKMIRLQATLKMLAENPGSSLTSLALEQYYDQAHFIKDFKEFTGKTPRQFYEGNLMLTALFIE